MIRNHARPAYALGYAEGGAAAFPMPEWVASSFAAVMETAEGHDSVVVLEMVRRSGRQDAIQAAMDRHKDDLEAQYRVKFHPILRQIAQHIVPLILRSMRATTEAVQQSDPYRKQAEDALATIQELGLWDDWQAIVRDGLINGAALGIADAEIWIAHTRGLPLPDFDLTFQSALQALRNLGSLPGYLDPEAWQGKQLQGIAYQLSGDLANAAASGLSGDQLAQIIMDTVGGDDSFANLLLDNALGLASIQGALYDYRAMGVEQVDVLLSAGACEICESLAVLNPYTVQDAPVVPVHPNCRCDLIPSMG